MNRQLSYNLITILGPTASGKTAVAASLAHAIDAEILSADSRQVYRNMNIGTGKDLNEYCIEGKNIPYHLIDIVDAGTAYNVFQYQHDFFTAYQNIISRKKNAVLCGGSGLYIQSVLRAYHLPEVPENKELRKELEKKSMEELETILRSMQAVHNKTDFDTKKRAIRAIEIATYNKEHPADKTDFPHIHSLVVGIRYTREQERQRITQRLEKRLKEGMIEEVRSLLNMGLSVEQLLYYGLEYKFITQYLIGAFCYEEMERRLNTAIHQFAKRQMTWFRKMEREGILIHWIDGEMPLNKKVETIINLIREQST